MSTVTTNQPMRQLARQHFVVLMCLAAFSLAIFLIVAPNNHYGEDEWQHIYTTSRALFQSFAGRLGHLVALGTAYRLLGVHPLAPLIAYQIIRIATAFTLYLLIRHFTPQDPLFAFVCGLLCLGYFVNDDFLLRASYMTSFASANLYAVLALYLFAQGHAAQDWKRLLLSLLICAFAISTYEGVVPILAAIPPLVVIAQPKQRSRDIVLILLWEAVIGLSLLRVILPMLGLASPTYVSNQTKFMSLSISTLIQRLIIQIRFGLADPLLLQRRGISIYAAPAVYTVTVGLLGLAIAKQVMPKIAVSDRMWLVYLRWLLIGAALTVLGFLLILPTIYGQHITRVHVNSLFGEAIFVASLIWLATQFMASQSYRIMIRFAAIGMVLALNSSQVAGLQRELVSIGAIWEEQAYFVRSLVNVAPSVKPNTLFVFVHHTEDLEPPFFQAQGFEYLFRHFYADKADGIWLLYDHVLLRTWSVTDDGIQILTSPEIQGRLWERDAFYRWDEIVIVMRDPATGRAMIMDELPPLLDTPESERLYAPYDRLEVGYVHQSIQDWFPPIQSPNR